MACVKLMWVSFQTNMNLRPLQLPSPRGTTCLPFSNNQASCCWCSPGRLWASAMLPELGTLASQENEPKATSCSQKFPRTRGFGETWLRFSPSTKWITSLSTKAVRPRLTGEDQWKGSCGSVGLPQVYQPWPDEATEVLECSVYWIEEDCTYSNRPPKCAFRRSV